MLEPQPPTKTKARPPSTGTGIRMSPGPEREPLKLSQLWSILELYVSMYLSAYTSIIAIYPLPYNMPISLHIPIAIYIYIPIYIYYVPIYPYLSIYIYRFAAHPTVWHCHKASQAAASVAVSATARPRTCLEGAERVLYMGPS